MIGAKLKQARAASGLSLRDLEAKLGKLVTAQAIGMYERDEISPRSDVLIRLAETLSVSVPWLSKPDEIALSNIDFRKRKLTKAGEEAAVKASVADRLQRYLELEDLLALQTVEWRRPKHPSFRIKDRPDEAEGAAERLRELWKLGADPLPSLGEFLEERGLKVIFIPLPNRVSGLTCTAKRSDADTEHRVIVVNKQHSGERNRYTLAHELAHLVLEIEGDVDGEKAADRFAGAFLVPREALEDEVGRHRTAIRMVELFALKRFYGASVKALIYRLQQLDIISGATATGLFKQYSAAGYNSPPSYEPEEYEEFEPLRFQRLCVRAAAEELLSEGKAAELLDMPVEKFLTLMEARDIERGGARQ